MRNPKWFFDLFKYSIVSTIFFWIVYALWKAVFMNYN